MNLLNKTCKIFTLFFFGGITYNTLERMARGHTHWTMFIVGGLCFCMIGLINEVIPWEMAFWKQCVIGGCIVTAVEFISGCIFGSAGMFGITQTCLLIFWVKYAYRFHSYGASYQRLQLCVMTI